MALAWLVIAQGAVPIEVPDVMSAPPANQPPLIVQFLLSIIEILAAFALMPLLLLFIVAGLLYNILKHFLIPFLIVVAVIVVAFVYLLPQSPA